MHVGAQVSGSSSVGSSGNLGYSNNAAQQVSCTTTNTSSINYEADQLISHDCPQLLSDGTGTVGGGFG